MDRNRPSNFGGFNADCHARTAAGLPMDRFTLMTLAARYNTPVPGTDDWYELVTLPNAAEEIFGPNVPSDVLQNLCSPKP